MQRMVSPGNQSRNTALQVKALGGFRVWRKGEEIPENSWGREKAIHLFQFLITIRKRHMHKEQIIDQLWPELSLDHGNRDFKVALNSILKTIEPERAARQKSRFIHRFNLAYGLNIEDIQIDCDEFDAYIEAGNQVLKDDPTQALIDYRSALRLYSGEYLPERCYEDWTSAERERLSTLALSSMTTLAELELSKNPRESLRLTQRVITWEPLWEEAYRVQMRAHQAIGNRPMALRTYQQLAEVLLKELGIEPLPESQRLSDEIRVGR